jgi:hypothetical protein
LTKQLSLSASFNNLFNDNLTRLIYGSQTPAYARLAQNFDYGTVFSVGIKGVF